MIRPCKGGSSWLGGCKGRVKSVFLSLILTWVIDMLFEKLTPRVKSVFLSLILTWVIDMLFEKLTPRIEK